MPIIIQSLDNIVCAFYVCCWKIFRCQPKFILHVHFVCVVGKYWDANQNTIIAQYCMYTLCVLLDNIEMAIIIQSLGNIYFKVFQTVVLVTGQTFLIPNYNTTLWQYCIKIVFCLYHNIELPIIIQSGFETFQAVTMVTLMTSQWNSILPHSLSSSLQRNSMKRYLWITEGMWHLWNLRKQRILLVWA